MKEKARDNRDYAFPTWRCGAPSGKVGLEPGGVREHQEKNSRRVEEDKRCLFHFPIALSNVIKMIINLNFSKQKV